jgi:cytochrome c biogenesis protein CcdA
MLQFFITVYAGFTHAFETDHLLAVSTIVSNRHKVTHAVKDGIFWGLGHTSTIIFVGVLVIVMKQTVSVSSFHYFEAAVGLMLVTLALFRIVTLWKNRGTSKNKSTSKITHTHGHKLAYGVGLVHGLAGSGALVVLVMSQVKSPAGAMIYLLVFGAGSVIGMLVAAGLFSTPFSQKIIHSNRLHIALVLVSAALCILYGSKVIYQNLLV